MPIPGHWKLLDNLNDAAAFQAGNLVRQEYLMILAPGEAEATTLDQ